MTITDQRPTLREKRELRSAPDKIALLEQVIIKGDLAKLSVEERTAYYMRVCESAGLNPLTKPFEYITLNNRLTLYALRSATDQLRAVHGVSVIDMDKETSDGVHIVTVKVQDAKGRTDMGTGAVSIANLKGEALANALMKAETKAKRRATLSICGLGLLDETEVETIPGASPLAQSPAPGAAGEPTPLASRAPSSAAAKRAGSWEAFADKIASFADIDELEKWWAKPATQTAVNDFPNEQWIEQAHEAYEKAKEQLLKAGAP